MGQDFHSVGLKLRRARRHLNELARVIEQYKNSKPLVLTYRNKANGHGYELVVTDILQPPEDLDGCLGDCIHNMRSSLDHLAWKIVQTQNPEMQEPPKVLSFPIAKQGGRDAVPQLIRKRCIDKAHPECVKYILSLNPFYGEGGNKTLESIHQFDIEDKHYDLIDLGSAFRSFSTGPGLIAPVLREVRDIHTGMVLQEFLGRGVVGGKVETSAAFDVVFPRESRFGGKQIIPALEEMLRDVTQICTDLERFATENAA